MRRRIAGAVGAVLLAGAGLWALDRAAPPELSRLQDLSGLVTARDGRPLQISRAGDDAIRLAVAADTVDASFRRALISYEDKRFFHHPGVDPVALIRAAASSLRAGHIVSGGSTLTMQLARLLEPRPRTFAAKAIEIARALQLEARFSKADILSMYLTLAPYGGNLAGIRAASIAYFGHEPDRLSPSEIALLVALPQSPTRRRPDRHPDMAAQAAMRVAARVGIAGAGPMTVARDLPDLAPHFARRLMPGPGDRAQPVRSTLDIALQSAVEALARRETQWMTDGASLAAIVVENHGRGVRAYLGGADFLGPFGQIDLARARRSPGSALKPFIYGLAFDARIVHPETLIEDRATSFAGYAPHNFDFGFRGAVTVREALQQSLNIPAVALLDRVGPQAFLDRLAAAGARVALPGQRERPGLAIALGGAGITLNDMAMLYAALADDGVGRPLRQREDADPGPDRAEIAGPLARYYLTEVLAGAARPDQVAQGARPGQARRFAYKTGTSYGFRDAWAIGWSSSHTVAVWVGRADGSPRPGRLGRDAAAPILVRLFDLIPDNRGLGDAPPPPDALTGGTAGLPPGLRRFRPGTAAEGGETAAPKIVFPPDGAEVALNQKDGAPRELLLKAMGGRAPLRWYVNGQPVDPYGRRAEAVWFPDGPGFARIAVIDAAGQGSTAEIRLR